MKLTVEGCKHAKLKVWTKSRGVSDGYSVLRATCMACYERMSISVGDLMTSQREVMWNLDGEPWATDTPAPPCAHPVKVPMESLGVPKGFEDAICLDCGCVLRHPDGRGRWEEVVFNGFLIAEPP